MTEHEGSNNLGGREAQAAVSRGFLPLEGASATRNILLVWRGCGSIHAEWSRRGNGRQHRPERTIQPHSTVVEKHIYDVVT